MLFRSPVGAKFKGSCEVDGNNRDLSGDAPTRFTVEGHKLFYSFTPLDEMTHFSVAVNFTSGPLASVSSGISVYGIHGWVRFGRSFPEYGIESFDPKAPEKWTAARPPWIAGELGAAP